MEPIEAKVAKEKITVHYTMPTTVIKLEEKFQINHLGGAGSEAQFEKVSIGWFVQFEGSRESISFGAKPDFVVGDKVKITFQKVSE